MKSGSIKFSESMLKSQVKDLLAICGIYNYPIMQGLGCWPGLPDRVAHIKGVVIYIECKLPGHKMSPGQAKFEDQCNDDGIGYWVIRDIDQLEKILKALGVLK